MQSSMHVDLTRRISRACITMRWNLLSGSVFSVWKLEHQGVMGSNKITRAGNNRHTKWPVGSFGLIMMIVAGFCVKRTFPISGMCFRSWKLKFYKMSLIKSLSNGYSKTRTSSIYTETSISSSRLLVLVWTFLEYQCHKYFCIPS